jgi:hypothetical protein
MNAPSPLDDLRGRAHATLGKLRGIYDEQDVATARALLQELRNHCEYEPLIAVAEALSRIDPKHPSVSAKTPRADSLPYTATKFALQGMTHQLTMDGRKYGVVASILHPGATLSGRTKAGPGATPDDYVMAAEDVAKIVVLMCSLPPEVNLYEATILPNHMRSFIGRG